MDVIQENKNSHLPELKREGDKGAWVRKADIQFIMRTQKALNVQWEQLREGKISTFSLP